MDRRPGRDASQRGGRDLILPDTSAWIEYARASRHPVDLALLTSIENEIDIVITEPVVMELLAGAISDRHALELRSALLGFPLVAVAGLDDYEEAAAIQRACRAQGLTIRNTIDCLIAAVAMRVGATILHKDRDFDAIARCTDLKIQPVSPSPS